MSHKAIAQIMQTTKRVQRIATPPQNFVGSVISLAGSVISLRDLNSRTHFRNSHFVPSFIADKPARKKLVSHMRLLLLRYYRIYYDY